MIDLSTAVAVTKVTFLKCSKSEILRKNMNKYRKLLEKVKLKKEQFLLLWKSPVLLLQTELRALFSAFLKFFSRSNIQKVRQNNEKQKINKNRMIDLSTAVAVTKVTF